MKEGGRERRKEGSCIKRFCFQSGFLAFVALVTFVVFVASWLLRLLSSRLLGFLASLLLGDCCFWLLVFLAPCGFWLYAVYNDHILELFPRLHFRGEYRRGFYDFNI